MDESKVFMFKDGEKGSNIDPGLLALINNNGGFGNGGNWMWMMFLWLLYPLMSGGFNGFGGNRNDFIANLANNGQGRDLLLQAINGRADALGQLAGILNTSVETVKSGVNSLQVQVQYVNIIGLLKTGSRRHILKVIWSCGCMIPSRSCSETPHFFVFTL